MFTLTVIERCQFWSIVESIRIEFLKHVIFEKNRKSPSLAVNVPRFGKGCDAIAISVFCNRC